jgi:hypothetical protein
VCTRYEQAGICQTYCHKCPVAPVHTRIAIFSVMSNERRTELSKGKEMRQRWRRMEGKDKTYGSVHHGHRRQEGGGAIFRY